MRQIAKYINQLSKYIGTDKLSNHDTELIKRIAYKTDDGLNIHTLDSEEIEDIKIVWHKTKSI